MAALRTITTSTNPSAERHDQRRRQLCRRHRHHRHAVPNANYMFKRWQLSGSTVSNSSSYTFTVSANAAYSARFARIYPVTTSSNPAAGGTTTIEGSFEDGDNVTVTASANEGYAFINWTENGIEVSTDTKYIFTINTSRTLVANFYSSGSVTIELSAFPQVAFSSAVVAGGQFRRTACRRHEGDRRPQRGGI